MHFFESPSPGVVYGKLNWRVVEPDGEFLERHAVQRFVQDPKAPGHLQNYDNEYLVSRGLWVKGASRRKRPLPFLGLTARVISIIPFILSQHI